MNYEMKSINKNLEINQIKKGLTLSNLRYVHFGEIVMYFYSQVLV